MHHPLILGLLCLCSGLVWAADDAREKRIADELSNTVIEGDSLFLEAEGRRFWSIYTEPQNTARGAVLILHGRGQHPDTGAVVAPLRTQLPERGWATLAIQLPVLAKGSEFRDYAEILHEAGPRIEAAIAHLRRMGHRQVHLVAHSCGAQMTMSWLQNGGGAGIDSLVVISMGMTRYERHFGHTPPLSRLTIPVLDLYGANDFVRKRAPERLAMLRLGGNPASAQIEIPQGKHMLRKQGPAVVEAVAGWLERNAK